MKQVSIIVPVYNEQENIEMMVNGIATAMQGLPYGFQLLFVDDGSTDQTLDVIKTQAGRYAWVQYISLSRNFGHQQALKAGLDNSHGDCVISLDGDGQHPPALIPIMLKEYDKGFDIVYTIRKEDEHLNFFKRKTSAFFYNLLNRLSDVRVEKGSADFRLLSEKVETVLRNMPEHDLFFRGLVKWVGYRQTAIEFTPAERDHGISKYTVRKMFRLARNGMLSFSTKPLRFSIYLGFTFALLSVLYVPYAFISYFTGHAIPGWASVIVTIAFFGGLQLIIAGIIGLYIGSIFMQTKNRPIYIIRESSLP